MKQMKIIRFLPFLLFPVTFLPGCKTTQRVQTVPPVQQVEDTVSGPTAELRGHVMLPESWINDDADIMKKNISTLLEKIAEANYNAVFFFVNGNAESHFRSSAELWAVKPDDSKPGFDPLTIATEAAHEQNLKLYAGIDLAWFGDTDNLPLPQVKTHLKKSIRYLVENYDLDGLSFDLTDLSLELFRGDSSSMDRFKKDSLQSPVTREEWIEERRIDLIEHIVVEAMLVKPYLVNSILFTAEDEPSYVVHCLEEGIVDFIIPKIDIGINAPDQELKAFWDETMKNKEIGANVFPMFLLNEANENEEVISGLIRFIKANGGRGMVLAAKYTQPGITVPDSLLYCYTDKTNFPDNLKQVTPEQLIGLDVSALFPDNPSGQMIYLDHRAKTKMTDSEGYIGFITSNPDTIELGTSNGTIILPTERWAIPYKYAIQPDTSVIRKSPWVEFRRMPERYTDTPEYHLLCKTEYTASAWINDDAVKIYKTGVFFNTIILNEGSNRVRASVLTQDSLSVFYEREFIYEEVDKTRPPFPLWIDEQSIEPFFDLELLPKDIVLISFEGSLGQDGFVEVNPGGLRLACSRENHEDYTLYQAELPLQKLAAGNSYQVTLKLASSEDTSGITNYSFQLQNSILVRQADDFPMVKISEDNARITYTLGPSRLGAPIRSELGEGIILKTNGKIGEHYRIRLSRVETGMIHQNSVVKLPDETVQSSYFITNMSCYPAKDADVLAIPYLEPIPYEVYPDPDQNRITITLFGAKTSSTWVTHHRGRKIIDKVTWKQTTPETYQVYVNLKTPKIWGYNIRPVGKLLVLRIKYPPEYDLKNNRPLTGLKIAIEAGHGGSNTGAIGLSGLLEKDINLDLSLKLEELCKSMGAEIVQVRKSDRDMSLIEKRDTARLSDADMLISIHANAGGIERGYLCASGTSTYYNNPFWAPLAESVYDRLLELELAEFGVIGSFNYTVIRVSQMPSILVEQAFMSHAEDEEKLADPKFRQQIAEKIYRGIIDYLRYMKQ